MLFTSTDTDSIYIELYHLWLLFTHINSKKNRIHLKNMNISYPEHFRKKLLKYRECYKYSTKT